MCRRTAGYAHSVQSIVGFAVRRVVARAECFHIASRIFARRRRWLGGTSRCSASAVSCDVSEAGMPAGRSRRGRRGCPRPRRIRCEGHGAIGESGAVRRWIAMPRSTARRSLNQIGRTSGRSMRADGGAIGRSSSVQLPHRARVSLRAAPFRVASGRRTAVHPATPRATCSVACRSRHREGIGEHLISPLMRGEGDLLLHGSVVHFARVLHHFIGWVRRRLPSSPLGNAFASNGM